MCSKTAGIALQKLTDLHKARVKKPGSHLWLKIHLLIILLAGGVFSRLSSTAASNMSTLTSVPSSTTSTSSDDITTPTPGVVSNIATPTGVVANTTATTLNDTFNTTDTASVPSNTSAPSSVITSNTSNITTPTDVTSNNRTTATATQTTDEATGSPSSTAPSTLPTPATASQTSAVFYFLDVTVVVSGQKQNESEIIAWLDQVFETSLEKCLPSNTGQTTTTPAPTQTTAAGTSNVAALVTTASQNEVINGTTVSLFQGMEVSCTEKTAINNTKCSVMLRLSQSVPACRILQTLCAASKNSSNITVVGNKADKLNSIQQCNSDPEGENSCIYSGPQGASCEESGSPYVIPPSNSTNCSEVTINCNCSAYCNRSDAYYTFSVTVRDPTMNSSSLSSLMSVLKQQQVCFDNTSDICPEAFIASKYKSASVSCEAKTTNQNCKVVLGFLQNVSICSLEAAVRNVFQDEKQISLNEQVRRAAICGNLEASNNLLDSQVTWTEGGLESEDFCTNIQNSNILTCQNGTNIIQLEEICVSTTASPNVSTTQPNNNTSTANMTTLQPGNSTLYINMTTIQPTNNTSTLNMTALQPGNATSSINSTTSTTNTTSTTLSSAAPQNTTGGPVNTTTAANGTGTGTFSSTTATSNTGNSSGGSVTESAESKAIKLLVRSQNVSQLNSTEIKQLVSELEDLLSGPTVSLVLGNISVHIVSNLLGATPEKLSSSSNRKFVLQRSIPHSFNHAVHRLLPVRGGPRLTRSVTTVSSTPQGSITLPSTVTQDLSPEEKKLVSRLQFNFYHQSTVFQDRSLGERKLISGILGASVANLSIKGLKEQVVFQLSNSEPKPANYVATCVFWDFTMNNNSGGWSPDGCFVQNSTDNETICSCSHLTSFAILLDLSRQPVISKVQATILTFITYIGCGVSAIFLSITLLTYLAFEKLRKDIPSKILIELCFALLLLNLVFLVDAWLALYTDAVGLCISTAWFLHYFLLVVFTWMGLEGVHMYMAIVKVFNNYTQHYMLKFSLVGWGVPMLVVIIVIAIDKNNYGLVSYGKFTDGTSDDFCWLKNDVAFYVAVVAYFCVIFVFNFIMFVVVLVQLHRVKKQNPHNVKNRMSVKDVRSVLGITVLLGLTWGFAFFAWGPVNLPFMYLFAIFNSLQGFFIFVFHCAVKDSVRKQWRTYLCCGQMRLAENSDWSRTATQKTVRRSLPSFNSSQRNSSSNTSTYLVSTPSDAPNGISSPFDDRTITADEDPSMDVVLNEINRQYRNHRAT
ncbi:adhesion G-protein coupled receptor G2-like [Nematolebias whitei]|uniref:adhesion G-protein coupled receptor G2-like n=1 Tax=Nematolebias whitei TaxID=451745 RepID=UPI001899460B|nr:adhesion G-protein coupled receptor G2-like [Nematolebias whitei]